MTKMQYCMSLVESAMIFYDGLGEFSHKYFMKAPGDNTHQRVWEFARQIANRLYECMIFEIADEKVVKQDNDYEIVPTCVNEEFDGEEEQTIGCHDFVVRYILNMNSINNDGESGDSIVKWGHDNVAKSRSGKYHLLTFCA